MNRRWIPALLSGLLLTGCGTGETTDAADEIAAVQTVQTAVPETTVSETEPPAEKTTQAVTTAAIAEQAIGETETAPETETGCDAGAVFEAANAILSELADAGVNLSRLNDLRAAWAPGGYGENPAAFPKNANGVLPYFYSRLLLEIPEIEAQHLVVFVFRSGTCEAAAIEWESGEITCYPCPDSQRKFDSANDAADWASGAWFTF